MTIRELLDRARREEYLTVKQYALLFQYAEDTVYRKIKRGDIPALRMGRMACH